MLFFNPEKVSKDEMDKEVRDRIFEIIEILYSDEGRFTPVDINAFAHMLNCMIETVAVNNPETETELGLWFNEQFAGVLAGNFKGEVQ